MLSGTGSGAGSDLGSLVEIDEGAGEAAVAAASDAKSSCEEWRVDDEDVVSTEGESDDPCSASKRLRERRSFSATASILAMRESDATD